MINGKIIKVCGMREAPNIRDVESLQKVDMIGFIFYPKSPRYIYELPAYLPVRARRVGVFVNEDKDVITMYADRFGLEYIQLHGKESPEYCQSLRTSGLKIIKAFSVALESIQPSPSGRVRPEQPFRTEARGKGPGTNPDVSK